MNLNGSNARPPDRDISFLARRMNVQRLCHSAIFTSTSSSLLIHHPSKTRRKPMRSSYACLVQMIVSVPHSKTMLRLSTLPLLPQATPRPPMSPKLLASYVSWCSGYSNTWLRLSTNTAQESVVHRRKKKGAFTLEDYIDLMAACFHSERVFQSC